MRTRKSSKPLKLVIDEWSKALIISFWSTVPMYGLVNLKTYPPSFWSIMLSTKCSIKPFVDYVTWTLDSTSQRDNILKSLHVYVIFTYTSVMNFLELSDFMLRQTLPQLCEGNRAFFRGESNLQISRSAGWQVGGKTQHTVNKFFALTWKKLNWLAKLLVCDILTVHYVSI